MKRKINIFMTGLLMTVFMASCVTTNSVTNGRGIQKRKYTKGFHRTKSTSLGSNKTAKTDKTVEFKEDERAEAVETNNKPVPTPVIEKNNIDKKAEVAAIPTVEATKGNIEPKNNAVASKEASTIEEANTPLSIEKKNPIHLNHYKNKRKAIKKAVKEAKAADSGILTVLLVILALILPWLAVLLYEGPTGRFWLTLLFWLIGYGVGFWLLGPELVWLFGLIAVIYAILIVVGAI